MAKDSDQAREDERDEDERDEDERDEDERDADEEEDDERDEDDESEAGERDESTKGVAKALGVDEDEPEEGEAAEATDAAEADEPKNRAARRREEALRRRATREAKKRGESDPDAADVVLPKDRNAKARELLQRRKEAAEKSALEGLTTTEVVQDQLVRAGSATTKWFTDNLKYIGGAAAAALLVAAGYLFYVDQQAEKSGAASDALARGLVADKGRVLSDDKRSEEEKKADPLPAFSSSTAKADAVLAAYQKTAADHPSGGPAILAKLGVAGAQLDKGAWDEALATFDAVLATDLAKADIDVRARALEGKAFALEGKKDFAGATAVFRELGAVDATFVDLAGYHEARMLAAEGKREAARDKLKELEKKLELPAADGSTQNFLKAMVNETMRTVDPTSAPARRPSLGGPKGGQITPEELARMQEEARRRIEEMQKKQGDEHGHEEPAGETP